MQRITISIDQQQLAKLDKFIDRQGYASRSEAIRDILRSTEMHDVTANKPETLCYATLTWVYEHETRELSKRLTELQHHHHDLSVASLHVHASHNECLEVAVLKGRIADIQELANEMLTQRGVRMGHLHAIPALPDDDKHNNTHTHK